MDNAPRGKGRIRWVLVFALSVLLLIFAGIFLPHPVGKPALEAVPSATPAAKTPPNALQIQFLPPAPDSLAPVPSSPLAFSLGTGNSLEKETGVVLGLIEFYRREFGAVPAGENNRQITNALRGANPGRLGILPADHSRLSDEGELLDAWGTPFFFHQISRDEMDVRSAGPDGEFYTADDQVSRKKP